jgi:hypothetical protein
MTDKPTEKTEEEKKEEVAKAHLDKKNRLWDYASPKLITHEEYGNLANASEALYANAIIQVPTDHAYKLLFLPQLLKEGGAITSSYIQSASENILQNSFFDLKIEDALNYAGYKGSIKADYTGKYLNQIEKDKAHQIIRNAMLYQSDEVAKGILELRQKEIPKGLEKIIGGSEDKEQDKQ